MRTTSLLEKLPVYITATILALFFIGGCTKDEDEPVDPGTGSTTGTPVTGDFKWTLSNGSTVTADSAICYPSITTIYAYKTGLANTVELNLSDIVVGTYNISSISGNELKYVSNKITSNAASGTIKITGNTGGKMSGNFSANFSTGTITSISGEFSNVRSR